MDIARALRAAAGLATLGLATALAACAGPITVGNNDVSHLMTQALLAHATRSGELATTIYGNPFAPGPANDAVITALMHSPPEVTPFRFTTHPGPKADPNYRVILAFDPPKSSYGSDDAACSPGAKALFTAGAQASSGQTTVVATFCADNHFISQATMSGPRAANSDAPAFRKLMSDTVTNLFPFDAQQRLDQSQGGGGGSQN